MFVFYILFFAIGIPSMIVGFSNKEEMFFLMGVIFFIGAVILLFLSLSTNRIKSNQEKILSKLSKLLEKNENDNNKAK
jgi:hypothetical protein